MLLTQLARRKHWHSSMKHCHLLLQLKLAVTPVNQQFADHKLWMNLYIESLFVKSHLDQAHCTLCVLNSSLHAGMQMSTSLWGRGGAPILMFDSSCIVELCTRSAG